MSRCTHLAIGLCMALIAVFLPQYSHAQCTVMPTAVAEGTVLPTTGGTAFRGDVVFNPDQNLYYSMNTGSASYPIETYDINGTALSGPGSGFDYRGLWWNPVTSQLEGNGFGSGDIVYQNLNATTGYAEAGTNFLFTSAQPDVHSSGALDVDRYEIVYYFNNQITRYDRTNNSLVGTLNVTGLPASVGTLNANQIITTGCAGLDYALYDITNKTLLFLDATGAYVSSSQLPASAPTNSSSGRDQVSFANNLLWLYDATASQWIAYDVISVAAPPPPPTSCMVMTNAVNAGIVLPSATGGTGNRSAVAFNPNAGLYYSVNAGSSSYPMETYDINGTLLSSPSSGFDYRGCWWNPVTNQVEGNGFSGLGIQNQNLDPSTSYALNGGSIIFSAAQPENQSEGDLDVNNYYIVYYFNNQIYRFDRTNNAPVDTLDVTGLPATVGTISGNSIMATGCVGLDYALYDVTNQTVLFLDGAGAYVASSQLPSSAPTHTGSGSNFQVGMANGLLWLYDSSDDQWEAYEVLMPVANCDPLPTAVNGGIVLPIAPGGTGNRSAVAYNPNENLYYSVNAGSSSYPIETFDANGTQLSSPSAGASFRGAWWNPTTGQLEGNLFGSGGIHRQDLNATNGYALGTGSSIFSSSQPDAQSVGDLDVNNYYIVYYFNNQIYRYDRTNNAPVDTLTVTGLPAGIGTVNATTIMATGCVGIDYGLYDITNKTVFFINDMGAYVGLSQLPSSAPTHTGSGDGFQVSFANGMLWLYDSSDDQWESFQILQNCPTITASVADTICEGDTLTFGTQSLTASGTYMETFVNFTGCDSVVTLDLVVNPTFLDSVSVVVCAGESYTFPDGSVASDIQEMLVNTSAFAAATGCDSTIVTTVSVSPTYEIMVMDTVCAGDSYMFPDGSMLENITAAVVDTSVLMTMAGPTACDSVVIVDLAVSTVDAGLSSNAGQLIATAVNASYQWMQCDSGFVAISGETGQVYTPTVSGNYAVEVTDPVTGCTDTSECVSITVTGIYLENNLSLQLYPNPATSQVRVKWGAIARDAQVRVFDAAGKLIQQKEVSGMGETSLNLTQLPQGVYTVQLRADGLIGTQMLIKQ